MKAFQNLRNAVASALPYQQSSSQSQTQAQSQPQSQSRPRIETASSSKNESDEGAGGGGGGSRVKRRLKAPFTRLSASPRYRPSCEKKPSLRRAETAIPRETSPETGKEKKLGIKTVKMKSSPKLQVSPGQGTRLGFPCDLPEDLISEVEIQAKFNVKDKKAGVIITRSLLVLRVEEYSIFYGKLKICDFLKRLENEPIVSKKQFYDKLKLLRSSGKEFNLVLKRPLWNTPATKLPKGYDRAPGYSYIRGLMILYPGGNLGMNVKSYNSKVYVTSTDQMSMASLACLMGDCIVDVDGTPVTSTASCGERVISGLKENKFVLMTIERAVVPQAIRVVKYVLLVEKVPEKDPRMAQDTTKIGLDEADRIRRNVVPPPMKGIYRGKHYRGDKRLVIREMSMFTPIGAEPFNPLLMQAVPPKRMDAMHASKTGQVHISTPLQTQQQKSKEPTSGASTETLSGKSRESVSSAEPYWKSRESSSESNWKSRESAELVRKSKEQMSAGNASSTKPN